jgi:hypothetical protein
MYRLRLAQPKEMRLSSGDRTGAYRGIASEDDTELPGGPLENPRIERIAGDPLLEPHPSEPGVTPDGCAAPLENPGGAWTAF